MFYDFELSDIEFAKKQIDILKLKRKLVEVGLTELTSGNNADNIVAFGNAAGQLMKKIDEDTEYYKEKIANIEADEAERAKRIVEPIKTEEVTSNEEH